MTPSEARDELLSSEPISAFERLLSHLTDHLEDHARAYAAEPEIRALMADAVFLAESAVHHLKVRAMTDIASELSNRTNAEQEAA